MLSGNGRHRRPRQAPALLVAAGVTGSAIAIPLLAASGASAADGTVWDKVAQCETGGSWSADEGGGEYGGLSLTQKDWEAHGGLDYATSPDLASRSQQIAVAQEVLAAEGIGAWGTCGLTSGLTQENGALNVDTGVADGSSGSSDSSGSSGLSDLSRGLSGSSGSTADDDSSAGSSDSSADSSSSPSASASSPSSSSSTATDDSGTSGGSGGRSGGSTGAGSPAATPGADESDKYVQDEGSWSLVDTGSLGSGKHRGATADEAATKSATDTGADGTTAASAGRHAAATYVVQEGDSLESIADSLGIDGGWRALYAENRDLIGVDPSAIAAGQTLDTGVE
ncbi:MULTISPECIES: transglycosylase family protein [unclassified Streptomyces]|uniref:LysM peptidoglycan-binding domain-containing protein n=1 Tax=unclassified Streptomyces TaxID=2593676 RepID=UPI00036986BB|nr:transglycosylase family protein [Streptomyces sp. 303MFCol5.2]